VIPFEMIVLHKLRDRASEVPLPQRNHSTETFFLDRPNESLGVSIRVRGALRCQGHADSGVAKPLSHCAAPFPIPIADQHTMPDQHPVIRRRHETHVKTISSSWKAEASITGRSLYHVPGLKASAEKWNTTCFRPCARSFKLTPRSRTSGYDN
jgi:hypothetical protein